MPSILRSFNNTHIRITTKLHNLCQGSFGQTLPLRSMIRRWHNLMSTRFGVLVCSVDGLVLGLQVGEIGRRELAISTSCPFTLRQISASLPQKPFVIHKNSQSTWQLVQPSSLSPAPTPASGLLLLISLPKSMNIMSLSARETSLLEKKLPLYL